MSDQTDTTSGNTGTTWTFEYDRGENILKKKRYAYTIGTLGSALQTISYGYDTTWKDMKISQIETYYSNVYGGAFDHDDWLDVMFH